jgi:hypothetical protein
VTESYPFPWRFDPARYFDVYLMRQMTEAQVQRDILALLHSYDVDAVPIDAGGRRQRGRMMAAAKKIGVALAGVQNVKTGSAIPRGFADLEATLAPAGRALYIEVKAPAWIDVHKKVIRKAGEPSEEQLQFLHAKHLRGALVLVAWSADDVFQQVQRPLLELNWKTVR